MKKAALLFAFFAFLAVPAWAAPKTMSLTVDHGESLMLSGPATSVFVANPEIADVQVMSPTQVMLFGKRTGETSFMATDSKGAVLAERTLIVSQDLSLLRQELKTAIPGSSIRVSSVPGGIVLTGTANDAAAIADAYKIAQRFLPQGGDIINRATVTGSNQVHIRVRFAEVQRTVDNSLGFNWQSLLHAGGITFGLATGNAVEMAGAGVFNTGAANNSGLFPRPNNPSLSMPNNVIGSAYTGRRFTVDTMIDALAQNGFLTILAEPNLTAMSGETANFLAGGQFPIPIPQGNGTISVQFQPYGISLAFTPTLLSGDRISLHVRPEVSELTQTGAVVSSNISVPALITRKAETTVEVGSGESFAIAGLMNNSQTQSVTKFPGLGDLPVLGTLFRSDHFINGQTELVVIITPYIVKPSKKQLALPTDGFAPPTESERLLDHRYTNADPSTRPTSGDPVAVSESPEAAPVKPVTMAPELSQSAEPLLTKTAEPIAVKSLPETEPSVKAPEPLKASSANHPAYVAKKPEKTPAATSTPVSHAAETALAIPPLPGSLIPASATPLVLHPAGDADKSSGGLIVE